MDSATENLSITVGRRKNSSPSRVFAVSVFISIFFVAFSIAAFWSCSHKCLRSAASPL